MPATFKDFHPEDRSTLGYRVRALMDGVFPNARHSIVLPGKPCNRLSPVSRSVHLPAYRLANATQARFRHLEGPGVLKDRSIAQSGKVPLDAECFRAVLPHGLLVCMDRHNPPRRALADSRRGYADITGKVAAFLQTQGGSTCLFRRATGIVSFSGR